MATLPTNKINNQITAPQVRVIDETDQNIGVLTLPEALKLARDKGMDLIEITAAANPPVCKIISYDKFRYQQEKKLKKQRSSQKGGEQKEVQISVREAKNDLMMKVGRIHEFLGEGHRVSIVLSLRGREKGNKDFARKKLEEFLTFITVPHQVISPVSFGMRGFTAVVAKK